MCIRQSDTALRPWALTLMMTVAMCRGMPLTDDKDDCGLSGVCRTCRRLRWPLCIPCWLINLCVDLSLDSTMLGHECSSVRRYWGRGASSSASQASLGVVLMPHKWLGRHGVQSAQERSVDLQGQLAAWGG